MFVNTSKVLCIERKKLTLKVTFETLPNECIESHGSLILQQVTKSVNIQPQIFRFDHLYQLTNTVQVLQPNFLQKTHYTEILISKMQKTTHCIYHE